MDSRIRLSTISHSIPRAPQDLRIHTPAEPPDQNPFKRGLPTPDQRGANFTKNPRVGIRVGLVCGFPSNQAKLSLEIAIFFSILSIDALAGGLGVAGSNPVVPTNIFKGLAYMTKLGQPLCGLLCVK